MQKFVSILAVCAVIAGGAFAQKAPKDAKTPKAVKCAVMPSHSVDIAGATKSKMFADYKGRRYFFCCAGCPSAFKANPAKYAKAESIPTPKSPAPKKKNG